MEQQHLTTEFTFFGSVCLNFNVLRFTNFSKLGEVVLFILYSNAQLEHLFRIIQKNKTDACSSLKLDGTPSSILAVK